MRALTTGLWKEWRDHRAIAVALALALPLLVGGAAWAFDGALDRAGFVGLALFVPVLAHALFVVAVASEVFGGERRRGTLALLARLPAGLSRSLASKVAFYAGGSAAMIAWGLVVGFLACAVLGPAGSAAEFSSRALQPATGAALPLTLLAGQVALGCWVLFASTFVPQGGAAVLAAPLLLAALALPAALALREHDWLVARWFDEVLHRGRTRAALAGALTLAALLPLAASHLRGARRLTSSWSAAWRGLVVLVPIVGGGYAYGHAAVVRATLVDPASPRFRIESAYLGDGGRYLFVNACATPTADGDLFDPSAPPSTPTRPLLVDLADGRVRVVGRFRERWMRRYEDLRFGPDDLRAPTHVAHLRVDHTSVIYDAATGQAWRTFGREMAWEGWATLQRVGAARRAWFHDAEGRALWIEQGERVREGDPPALAPSALPRRGPPAAVQVIAGGWVVGWPAVGRTTVTTVEAATGRTRAVPPAPQGGGFEAFVSPRRLLRRERGAAVGTYTLLDLDGLEDPRQVALPAGCAWVGPSTQDGRMLVTSRLADGRRVLGTWSPVAGDVATLRDAEGLELDATDAYTLGRTPGDRFLVRVRPGATELATALYVVDGGTGRAGRVPGAERWRDLVLEPDGSVVGVEDHRRVVRRRPDRTSVVLFP